MSRNLRMEYPGALCHVRSRGETRRPILLDRVDQPQGGAVEGCRGRVGQRRSRRCAPRAIPANWRWRSNHDRKPPCPRNGTPLGGPWGQGRAPARGCKPGRTPMKAKGMRKRSQGHSLSPPATDRRSGPGTLRAGHPTGPGQPGQSRALARRDPHHPAGKTRAFWLPARRGGNRSTLEL